ncbi:glycosyl hydrolase family 18 protein [Tenacibaculum sp. SDUM215027]|uniref:glycosyl hydrolase family 18 protein n=1 Tax=Tenacibaculum sp. SDUM215027 TaxID=3422596 RepID=UPI003D322913
MKHPQNKQIRLLIVLLFLIILITSCSNKKKKVTHDNNNQPSFKHEKTARISDSSEFISQRHLHEQKYSNLNFSTERQWDSLNNISHKPIAHKKGTVHPKYRTFGWHVYSNGSSYKNYNFSMLWGVSYFSYTVDPKTGNYKSIHQWKTTSLIDSAKVKGCKVFLSVTNFGSENNTIFLNNSKAQAKLVENLAELLALRNANGINIDFEGVAKEDRNRFTQFIIQVSIKLKEKNPNYMVSLCLYAIDWNDVFDIPAINPHIDFYTLMGYDYYGSFSKTTGPVTPFKYSKKFGNGLEASVNYYKDKGVPLNKLIAGLPYYGAEWYTKNSKMGAKVTKFKSHPRYNTIRDIYIDSLQIPIKFDPKSASSYIIIKDSNQEYRQLFFEDVQSLSMKYDWIKHNKIGGVGIWALGYDNGYSQLWDLLADKFSKE